MSESVDLGALIADARAAGPTGGDAPPPAPVVAAPAVVAEPEPAAPDVPVASEPPTPIAEVASPPDPGAPEVPQAPTPAEPTPEEKSFQEACTLAGIDPASASAKSDLAKAFVAARQAPPVAAAPPAPVVPAEPQVTLDQVLAEYADNHEECRGLVTVLDDNLKQANELAVRDRQGRVVGGKLHEINSQIATIKSRLEPAKVGAFEAPELDEFQQTVARSEIARLRGELFEFQQEEQRFRQEAKRASTRYWDIVGEAKRDILARHSEVQETKQREAERVHLANDFEQEWGAAFTAEFAASGLPKESIETVKSRVQSQLALQINRWRNEPGEERKMFTRDGGERDLLAHVSRAVKAEFAAFDNYHRLRSAQYNDLKRRDATVQAPVAAVAAGTPGAGDGAPPIANPREALENSLEQIRRQRAAIR